MDRKALFLFFFFVLVLGFAHSQTLLSPDSFCGHKIGSKYTPHYQIVEYVHYLSKNSKQIKVQDYGTTYEGRPLLVAILSSPENLSHLDEIRKNNLGLAGLNQGNSGTINSTTPVIIWLSYNVHGNEPSSSEAALNTLYEILSKSESNYKSLLEKVIIIIDPCLNPDGRERYVNFFNQSVGVKPDPNPFAREHLEPWPGGRFNHYYFDLNRDWSWQTQGETIQRMDLFNSWLPQIHVDFHEMEINSSYYFSPAGEPFHTIITPWQREFQETVGKGISKSFENRGWLYFNREDYDLLYPSYGDTYPTYNGSIGMTYEQAGGPSAGISIRTKAGDTLTLTQRVLHHFISGMSTIQTSFQNAIPLLTEFQKYFSNSKAYPTGHFKSYVLKFDERSEIRKIDFENFLTRNGIEFNSSEYSHKEHGLNYFTQKVEDFNLENNDIILSANQPKSRLLQAIMEPKTFISDSITYDITAWALPYAWGIPCYALDKIISLKDQEKKVERLIINPSLRLSSDSVYAYLVDWTGLASVKALSYLWKSEVKIRFLAGPLTLNKRKFLEGTLLITKASNEKVSRALPAIMDSLQTLYHVKSYAINTAFSKTSTGLASKKVHFLLRPEIGIVYGESMEPSSYGELWEYFDGELAFPVHQIPLEGISAKGLKSLNVLVISDIIHESLTAEAQNSLQAWIKEGGKLILIEGALKLVNKREGFNIKIRNSDSIPNLSKKKEDPMAFKYMDRERKDLRNMSVGAIFKVDLDNSNPLAYGFPGLYFTLKNKSEMYEPFSKDKGWNVGIFKKDAFTSGFCGDLAKKLNQNSLAFGWQDYGAGSVVYFTDDPIFRSFWINGKLLFSNAVFMVGN